jgi:hypothetical protein
MDLASDKYHLKKAIAVEVERDAAGIVVSEKSTGAFHYDADLSRAVSGFLNAFVEEFEFLSKNEKSLSAALSAELETFRTLVEHCSK